MFAVVSGRRSQIFSAGVASNEFERGQIVNWRLVNFAAHGVSSKNENIVKKN